MSENTLGLSISEKERAVQIAEARRLAQLEVAPKLKITARIYDSNEKPKTFPAGQHGISAAVKKKYVPKGHDAIIKDYQANKSKIFVESLSGDIIHGVIVGSDRYTISVKITDEVGVALVEHIYKHGIFSFGKEEQNA